MFITTRQLNAALSGLRLAYDIKDSPKDKEFYRIFQESLVAGITKCLERKLNGLEVPDLAAAEFIVNIAAIHDEELKKNHGRR